MKELLQRLIAKMPSLNLGLKNPHLIADTTWLDLTNSTQQEKKVYIFRSLRQEWLVAVNGEVAVGEWDYFPNTHSVLMMREEKSVLYNALLINGQYLVLKQDAYQEGILLVNQAYYLQLLEQVGVELAMKRILTELKDLAVSNWAAKPKTASPTEAQEEVKATEEIKEEKVEEKVALKPELEKPREEEPQKRPSEQLPPENILERYRKEAKEESLEVEEHSTIGINISRQESLNDRLKAQLNKDGQSTLLDKLHNNQSNQE